MIGSLSSLLLTLGNVLGKDCDVTNWQSYTCIARSLQQVVLPPVKGFARHRDAMHAAFVMTAVVLVP